MKVTRIVLVLILALFLTSCQVGATKISLVMEGSSEYDIVLSKDASPSEKHAANELQKFIFEISGAKLPITTEISDNPKHMIVLGNGETLKSLGELIDFKDLGDEGFAIKTIGTNLVIAGGRQRGTMYGVYAFLEDVLGCRWYTAYVSKIPKNPSITLKSLNIVQKPSFEYRDVFYDVAKNDQDWCARNKANGAITRLDSAHGGYICYGGGFVHTFSSIIPPEKYFKDHPEYFSLINGKRTDKDFGLFDFNAQLCLTNPDVLKIAKETVLQWIAENPDAKMFSVSQNDSFTGNCECDKCKAIDAEEGSPAGAMLRFVNAIADDVAKKYPDKLIDTLAYNYTENPPKITRPRPNVIIRMCPINQCQYHPYEKCEKNSELMKKLQGWNRICDNIYIWHYSTNFAAYLIPFPDLDQLAANIPMYRRNGVKGIMTQGTNYAGRGPAGAAGFMDDLRTYLIAKLLWNANADPKEIKKDFLNGYFGKAGKPIGEFLDILRIKTLKENIHGHYSEGIGADIVMPWGSLDYRKKNIPNWSWGLCENRLLTQKVMDAGFKLFDKAEKLADNPEVLARVKHAKLGLEFVTTMREVDTAAKSGTAEQKNAAQKRLESFTKACETDGIEQWWGGPILADFDKLSALLK